MRNLENDIESNEKNEIEIKAKTHSNRCWVRRGTHFCFHFPFAFVMTELNGIFRMGKLCSSNSLCTAHSLTNFSIVFKPRKRLEAITDDKMDEIKHSQICYHDNTPHHDYQAPTKLSSTFQLESGVVRGAWHSILWCLLAGYSAIDRIYMYTYLSKSIDFHSYKGHQSNNRFIYYFLLLHAIF